MDAQQIINNAIANIRPASAYRLARILGVSEASISHWKQGRNLPRAKHLLKMMEIAEKKKQKGIATIALLAALACSTGGLMAITRDATVLFTDYTMHYAGFPSARTPGIPHFVKLQRC